jgi:uroporphyrinogen-III synthase
LSVEKTRILYLGLRPKPGTFHYPVIRTKYLGGVEQALSLWPQFTHVIFTSQTAVSYWPGPWDKKVIAIGEKTAASLRGKGIEPLVAAEATQEGVIALISQIDGYFFLPHSKLSRSVLIDYFRKNEIRHFALALYTTENIAPQPIPSLDGFDEIVFTSPSTVMGFLEIYKKLPKDKKLTAIGPITETALLLG